MCRRVITHYIHHDVRAPMVMDSVSPNPVVYANPLRTNFHTCELQLPPLEFVANTPIEKCPYHTCCIPHAYVVYCADTLAFIDEQDVEDGMEPEECEAFFLEHHHERLPYFGDECSCREVPATWRNLMEVEGNCPEWFKYFVHEAQFQPRWEELCFRECERLYTLEQDTFVLCNSMLDMIESRSPYSRNMAQEARERFLKAREELEQQRKLVSDMFQWAMEPCGSCDVDRH